MQRIDGQLDFYRNWTEYKEGFGNFEGDFWIGLASIDSVFNIICYFRETVCLNPVTHALALPGFGARSMNETERNLYLRTTQKYCVIVP